jgi:hypothetical protein
MARSLIGFINSVVLSPDLARILKQYFKYKKADKFIGFFIINQWLWLRPGRCWAWQPYRAAKAQRVFNTLAGIPAATE